jgi:sulfur relay (sulfurtransferase) complex TusBCD TusD component (DsrE family)
LDNQTVLLFTHAGLGHSTDAALQGRLAKTFLSLLDEHTLVPAKICFYTEGVRLVCEGSPVLETLQSLERQGVELIVCRTCLEAFGVLHLVRVGVVGGMPDIIEAMRLAGKVISL